MSHYYTFIIFIFTFTPVVQHLIQQQSKLNEPDKPCQKSLERGDTFSTNKTVLYKHDVIFLTHFRFFIPAAFKCGRAHRQRNFTENFWGYLPLISCFMETRCELK